MPERGFDTSFWSDPFVQKLPQEGKTLFLYLWTNDHCNQAGLYEITLETISFETKISLDHVPKLLSLLAPKVMWYEDLNLIWVRAFLKRQSKSPKFLIAAAKCLSSISNNGLVKDFLEYNATRYSIVIPYAYSMHTEPIPSSASASASANASAVEGEGVEGGGEKFATICKIYEENMGLTTPLVSEKLKDICDNYPQGWFEAAVKEAGVAGVRRLSYVSSILERWKVEGFKTPRVKGGKRSLAKVPTESELDEMARKKGVL